MVKALRNLLLACMLLVPLAVAAAQETSRSLTGAQATELQLLTGQLADTSRSPQTRQEAAELLLSRDYPQAVDALRSFLLDAQNPSAQLAVAEAIARQGGTRSEFADALVEMVKGKDAAVRPVAARALASYKNETVLARLIALARDTSLSPPVRLAVIEALPGILDKQAVDALVSLLEDADPGVSQASADSLCRMTSIRSFGSDAAQWKRWWVANRNKRRSEWLSDLADSLARSKTALEADNARLRERLARAMGDLYTAVPGNQKDPLLLSFLADPIVDVRLVGATLAMKKLSGGEPLGGEMRTAIRLMLGDPDSRLRQAAAMLVAGQGDGESLTALLERLKIEETPAVRQAVLLALGQLRSIQALPGVLGDVGNRADSTAAAAAQALARILEKQTLENGRREEVVGVLLERYRLAAQAADGAALREALLAAMAVVGDKAFMPAIESALKDRAATVRLAAVSGLARCGGEESLSLIEPVLSDSDRGVRQAAIATVGSLNGGKHLQAVLTRTDPDKESDPAVRQQAWDVVTAILAKADEATLTGVIDALAPREDAADARIRIMQMWVQRLSDAPAPQQAAAYRQLGTALMQARRPAEAETHLAKAFELYREAHSELAGKVWLEWMDAMLASNDAEAMKLIARQSDGVLQESALSAAMARIETLGQAREWTYVIDLSQAALQNLAGKLSAERRAALENALAGAKARQQVDDRQLVAKLLASTAGADETARKAVEKQLQTLGARAVKPLLAELRAILTNPAPDVAAEKFIAGVLAQISPDYAGYDVSAALADKIKILEAWGKSVP